MRAIHFCLPIIIISLLLNACQSDSVSLKQAEQITADFSGRSFIPPPRTTDDLAGQLPAPEIPPTENMAFHCGNQERNGRWPTIFKEYLTRYKPGDRIDTSTDPVGNWNFKYGWELYRGISIAEIYRGNLKKAETAEKTYIAGIPEDRKGAHIAGYSHLAIIQLRRGDLSEASVSISEARDWYDRLSSHLTSKNNQIHTAWMTLAEGEIAQAKGNLAAAEKLFRTSLANFIKYDESILLVAQSRSKLAEVIAAQGRLIEAEAEARLALAHSIEYGQLGHISSTSVLHQFTKILLDQGRIKESEVIAAAAVWIYQRRCSPADSIEFAEARRVLAEALALQGRHEETLAIYDAIEASLGKDSLIYQSHFDDDFTFAYALIKQGNIHRAQARLQKSVNKLNNSYGRNHPRTAEAIGFLAIVQWKSGQLEQAEQHFRQAVSILQDPGQRAGVRPQNLRLIIENYMEMTSELSEIDTESANTLFVLAESLRNSVVEESITAMGARTAISTPSLARLLRKEQNSRARLISLESTFSNALSEGVDTIRLKSDIDKLRKAHVAILDKINDSFPDYAELLHPSPLSLPEVQQLIKQEEAFVATYSSTDKTYVWLVTKERPVHFNSFPVGKEQMRRQVAQLRRAFTPTGNTLASIPDYDLKIAYQFFQNILEPSHKLWKDKSSLIIAAHDSLGYLPFSALPTKKMTLAAKHRPLFSRYRNVEYLAKTHAVVYMPSANALRSLRLIGLVSKQKNQLIAFGDPWFNSEHDSNNEHTSASAINSRGGFNFRASPATAALNSANISSLPRLPETADELSEIALALGSESSSRIYLGKEASEERVKSSDLASYRIVAFATHGLAPGDLDGLTQPALAMSAPEFNDNKGDGLLTMDEIMNLDLNADWVLLLACNTGSSDGTASEAVSGLGRAFFYAGARSLLVSNWPVETNSARLLTTGVFNSSSSTSNRAEALRLSMMKLVDEGVYKDQSSGKILHSYAHPIFWAPFTLIGDSQVNE